MDCVAANKREKLKNIVSRASPYLITAKLVTSVVLSNMAMGATKVNMDGVKEGFTLIISILLTLITVIGALLIVVGIVKLVLAHTSDDSSAQQKAVLFIGTGITLVLLTNIFSKSAIVKKLT